MTFMTSSQYHECNELDFVESRGVNVCRVCGLVREEKVFKFETTAKSFDKQEFLSYRFTTGLFEIPLTYKWIENRIYDRKETRMIAGIRILIRLTNIFGFTFERAKRASYILHKLLKKAPDQETNTIAAISIYATIKESRMQIPFQEMMKIMTDSGISIKRHKFVILLKELSDLVDVSYEKLSGINKIKQNLIDCIEFHVNLNMITGGMIPSIQIIQETANLALKLKKNDKKERRQPYSNYQAICDAFFKIMNKNNLVVDITRTNFKKFLRTKTWI